MERVYEVNVPVSGMQTYIVKAESPTHAMEKIRKGGAEREYSEIQGWHFNDSSIKDIGDMLPWESSITQLEKDIDESWSLAFSDK